MSPHGTSGNVVDLIGSVLLARVTYFYKLFNLLVHVRPPYLFSEASLCACHTLVTLMCECNSMLPEAFLHNNTVASEDKLAKDP